MGSLLTMRLILYRRWQKIKEIKKEIKIIQEEGIRSERRINQTSSWLVNLALAFSWDVWSLEASQILVGPLFEVCFGVFS